MTDPVTTTDPVNWDAGDFHRWERPLLPPCPHCRCCSDRLCQSAVANGTTCDVAGAPTDVDLAGCPCGRKNPAAGGA